MSRKVYLAGPDVFMPDANIGDIKKSLLNEIGLLGLYPLDNELNETYSSKQSLAKAIYLGNIDMLNECDVVLANISPFRGPHCDPGTAYEIGYARALGKDVHLYSNDSRTLEARIAEDFPSIDQDQYTIEQFELQENLMIPAGGCEQVTCVDDRSDLSALSAFKTLLASKLLTPS